MMSDGPETVWARLRYRYEWGLYRLGSRAPFRFIPFVRNRSSLRFHEYLARREIVVPTAEGAKWRVFQADGRDRYVAANLYARLNDYAVRLNDKPVGRIHAALGGIIDPWLYVPLGGESEAGVRYPYFEQWQWDPCVSPPKDGVPHVYSSALPAERGGA